MSFKVICIGKKGFYVKGVYSNNNYNPKSNEIVNVIQSDKYADAYFVEEYPVDEKGIRQHFVKTAFIPLPEFKQTTYTKILEEIPMCNN